MDLNEYINKVIAENDLSAKVKERNIKVDDINEYCYSQAREKAKNQCACVDNETVRKWIIHYIEDDYLKKEEEPKPEPVKEEPKPVKKESNQMSLFDFVESK